MSWKPIDPSSFVKYKCPSCSNAVSSILGDKALYVVCIKCNKLFHNLEGKLTFSAAFKKTFRPTFAIGTSGKYKNKRFQLIGNLEVKEARTNYYWREYIVKFEDETMGYFMEYDGHWSYVEQIESIQTKNRKNDLQHKGEWYTFFNTYKSVTVAAEGDFFWNITEDNKPQIYEYINPPVGLVAEYKKNETNWYQSEYLKPSEIKTIFNYNKSLPYRTGRYSTQPLPFSLKLETLQKLCFFYAFIMMIVMAVITFFNNEHKAYDARIDLRNGVVAVPEVPIFPDSLLLNHNEEKQHVFVVDSNIFISQPIKISSNLGSTAIDVKLVAPVSNNWFEASFNLVNESTGQEYFFELGVEYYFGQGWTEGSTQTYATISEVPDGTYRLIIKPVLSGQGFSVSDYRVTILQNVTLWSNFFLLTCIGMAIPLSMLIYAYNFNSSRWSNSNITHG